MCVVIPFILDVRLVEVPAGVTQEEGHIGFLIHLPYAVVALNFLARRNQPSLTLVDRESRILCTNELIVLHLLGIFLYIYIFTYYFFVRKNPSSCDCPEIRTHVPTSEDFEVTN